MANTWNRRRTSHFASYRAFSLIELLVVIAIIAILSSIIFPLFAVAREKARQTACISNLKQLNGAISMYTMDHDEVYPCNSWNGAPIAVRDNDTHHRNLRSIYTWPWQIYPALTSRALLVCPSDPNPRSIWSGYSSRFPGDCMSIPTPISYAANLHIIGFDPTVMSNSCFGRPGPWISDYPVTQLSEVLNPSKTYLLADSGRGNLQAIWINNLRTANYTRLTGKSAPPFGRLAELPSSQYFNRNWSSSLTNAAMQRHSRGIEILFADGHVKFRSGPSVTSGDRTYDLITASEGLILREYTD